MVKTLDIQMVRQDFPILEQVCYLDSAATTQKPIQAIQAMKDFMLNSNGTVRRGVYDLSVKSTQAFDKARATIKNFLNASSSNEIIFTKGTTEAINLVAYSFTEWLRLGQKAIKDTDQFSEINEAKGSEILISSLEHHANIVPWQIHGKRLGIELKSIPVLDNGELDLAAYKELISSGKVKLVAITAIANSIGTIVPIKKITKIAHEHGALVLVDGAQAVAHNKIDLQDLDVDFFTFSGHKIYGPTGIGVLYGKEKLLNSLPPYHGGGEMIEKVSLEKTSFANAPFKFEAGTPPIVEAIGLEAAINYIEELGFEAIKQYEEELYQYTLNKLSEIEGLKIIGSTENKTGVISFVFDDIGSFDIGTMLNENGVAIRTGHHCAQPVMERFRVDSTARVSIAFYNTKEDIDKFIRALKKTVEMFRL